MFSRVKENNVLIFFILILSTQFLDVLFGIFAFLNLESGLTGGTVEFNLFNVPWSHSFVMTIFWSLLFGFCAYLLLNVRKDDEAKLVGILSGIGVFSHWILDIIVHNNDMLLDPFSNIHLPTLNFWQIPILSFVTEIILSAIFFYIYYSKMKEQYRVKPFIFLGIILLLIYHVFSYIPSNDSQTVIDGTFGLILSLLILIVVVILTAIHKFSVQNPTA